MEDADLALALKLQEQFNYETEEKDKNKQDMQKKEGNELIKITDQFWELNDPHPDIHGLFIEFNTVYFWNKLQGVEVRWSKRMTLCAGICCYEGHGGLCSVRLSLPLLQLRPRKDLVETLLHEMIHAYLFVTNNNRDHDSHGPEFLKHMNRINKQTGSNITVYHNFHDEVDLYRQHWWRCTGPCRKRPPYYGILRRAMNRAPSSKDFWWGDHQRTCGGTYEKFKEPEEYKNKRKTQDTPKEISPKKSKGDYIDIRQHFSTNKRIPDEKKPLSEINRIISTAAKSSTNKKSSSKSTISTVIRVPSVNEVSSKKTVRKSNSPVDSKLYRNNQKTTVAAKPSVVSADSFKNTVHTLKSPDNPTTDHKKSPVMPFSGNGYLLGGDRSKSPHSRILTQTSVLSFYPSEVKTTVNILVSDKKKSPIADAKSTSQQNHIKITPKLEDVKTKSTSESYFTSQSISPEVERKHQITLLNNMQKNSTSKKATSSISRNQNELVKIDQLLPKTLNTNRTASSSSERSPELYYLPNGAISTASPLNHIRDVFTTSTPMTSTPQSHKNIASLQKRNDSAMERNIMRDIPDKLQIDLTEENFVVCPVCGQNVLEKEINKHLDEWCL